MKIRNEVVDEVEELDPAELWKRVFVYWPRKTMDGYTVFLEYVWKCKRDQWDVDAFVKSDVAYHTNPHNLEGLLDTAIELLKKTAKEQKKKKWKETSFDRWSEQHKKLREMHSKNLRRTNSHLPKPPPTPKGRQDDPWGRPRGTGTLRYNPKSTTFHKSTKFNVALEKIQSADEVIRQRVRDLERKIEQLEHDGISIQIGGKNNTQSTGPK